MYFADLTQYAYWTKEIASREPYVAAGFDVVNIGWLEPGEPIPKGPVPEPVLGTILRLCCTQAVNRTRGLHHPMLGMQCPYKTTYDGREYWLGSAEIRVPGLGKRIYAAPNLVYHYIKDVDYLPPQEFLDAVACLPPPDS